MLEDIYAPPEEGVYVHGLFLEGAGWDRRGCNLVESKTKVLYELLPVMHLFVTTVAAGSDKPAKTYECPIYKKPVRTDRMYVTSVQLKTNQAAEHWVMRGTALLCDIK